MIRLLKARSSLLPRFSSSITSRASPFTIPSPPDVSDYKTSNPVPNKTFAYLMIGSLSTLGALSAKNVVADYLVHLSASVDVLALAKIEVNLASIPLGKNVILKWRGKPVFVRHRTPDEIQEANDVDMAKLRHKETDAERVQDPEWLVMLGMLTFRYFR